MFVRFGNIADISVKRHLCSFQPQQVTGYAFVYFYDAHTALRAIYGLRGGAINGVFFECCLSYKAEQLLKEVQGMGAVIKRQQTSNPSAFFKRYEQKGSLTMLPSNSIHKNSYLEHGNSSIYQQSIPSSFPSQPSSNDRPVNYRPNQYQTPYRDTQPIFDPHSFKQSIHNMSHNSLSSFSSSSMSPKSSSSFENYSSQNETPASSIFNFSRQAHDDFQQPSLNFEQLSSLTTQFSDLIM